MKKYVVLHSILHVPNLDCIVLSILINYLNNVTKFIPNHFEFLELDS